MPYNVVQGLEQTLGELERKGRLPMEVSARVELARLLAASLEGRPGDPNLAREFRQVVSELVAFAPEVTDDDDEFLREMRTAMGDPAQS